ncbi:MAG: DUF4145 domain-containing protein [Verrucomicrobiia bacterium]
MIYQETVWSKRARNHEEWDPDWITFSFTAWVKCDNSACGEEVAVAGDGGIETDYDDEGAGSFHAEYCSPRFCSPMPDIIEIPGNCPPKVASELRVAFALFWSDPSGAANHIRVALEALMSHLRIRERRKTDKGKFVKLNLHQRIELFREADLIIGNQLMALKWLGNTGSHDGGVIQNDVLAAFEIIEHALLELIEQRSKRLAALASGLEKKHRPGAKKHKLPF